MDYLRHIAVRKDGRFHHATCLRCGLRASAANDELLKRIFQNHLCRPTTRPPRPRRKT